MQEVVEDVQRIIHISKISAAAWDSFEDRRKEQLQAGLSMLHNHAIMCLELLNYYMILWKDGSTVLPNELESLRQENGRRVIAATKGMFLLCLSSIEFSMKHALRINSHPLEKSRKKIKFFNLIEESHKKKLVANDDFNRWQGVINIRNSVIHNNAI